MSDRARRLLFILTAPVSVPVYLLILVGANILGGAYYIVVEASFARLTGKPVSLSRGWMALLAVPVLIAAPFAAALHIVLWFLGLIGRAIIGAGRWQAGIINRGPAFAAGLIWLLLSSWAILTCINAAIGLTIIGMPVGGRTNLVQSRERAATLGELPPDMQERRNATLDELRGREFKDDSEGDMVRRILQSDDAPFMVLPRTTRWRLAGAPWFFLPAEFSREGIDHISLLFGPLLLVIMLAVRWPGTFSVLHSALLRWLWMLARVGLAAIAVFWITRWRPAIDEDYWYFFEGDRPSAALRLLSPAWWIGFDIDRWPQREWVLFNGGLWLVLIGAAILIWWAAWRISPFLGWPRYYVAYLASRLLQRKRIAFFSVGAVTLCVAMMIIVISVMGGFVDTIRERAHSLLGDLVMDGDLRGFPFYQEFLDQIAAWKDPRTGQPLLVQGTPLIYCYGILQFPDSGMTKAVRAWGIRLDEYVKVNGFGEDLFYHERYRSTTLAPCSQPVYGYDDSHVPVLPGEMDANLKNYFASLPAEQREEEEERFRREPSRPFRGPGVIEPSTDDKPGYIGKPYPGLIIGRDILFNRTPSGDYVRSDQFPLGAFCQIALMPLSRTGAPLQEAPPKPGFRYIDDSRTGIHEIDSLNTYADFEFLQRMLDMGEQPREGGGVVAARCSQVQMKFIPEISKSTQKTLEVKERVVEAWNRFRNSKSADPIEAQMMSRVEIQTWEEMQSRYISAIEKEKVLVLIMFGVISLVAVFLILCIFYMIVQEKTRDIGIIKSVGASAEGVTAVFLAYGAAIGLVGSILGSLLGIAFVEHINDIQEWLVRLNPNWRVWSADTYSFDKIPDEWKWAEVIGISILAIVSSIVGAAFPATRAGRTWPVESLRYE